MLQTPVRCKQHISNVAGHLYSFINNTYVVPLNVCSVVGRLLLMVVKTSQLFTYLPKEIAFIQAS